VNFTPKQEEPWEDGASAAQLHVQSLEPSREKLMLRQFHGSLPEQQKLPDIRRRYVDVSIRTVRACYGPTTMMITTM